MIFVLKLSEAFGQSEVDLATEGIGVRGVEVKAKRGFYKGRIVIEQIGHAETKTKIVDKNIIETICSIIH